MTASGPPQGEEPGPQQEGIWETSDGAGTPAGGERAQASGADGLTRRLTSTARTPGPAGLIYADVPNRIMALILDIIVLSTIGFALAWLFGGLVSERGALDASGGELDMVAFLVVVILQLAVSFVYFGGSWRFMGATPSMWLLGLRVGDAAEGQPVRWRQALVRWLLLGIPALLSSLAVYVPNAIGLILGALGVVWMAALLYTMAQSPTKQGLHDRYAHTIVVKARRRSA